MIPHAHPRSSLHVAIVGGGASGALTAINLLRVLGPRDRVTLLDRAGSAGKGIAFGTSNPAHLLNVRAGNMALFTEKPEHFCEWLFAKGYSNSNTLKEDFVPRVCYGEYIREMFDLAVSQSAATLDYVSATADRFACQECLSLSISNIGSGAASNGGHVAADHFVLALGNLIPGLPQGLMSLADHEGLIHNPWNEGALAKIASNDTVFIAGTGLTMVDQILALRRAGHSGRIIARSRRGFLPQPHAPVIPKPIDARDYERSDLFSHIIDLAREAGEDWRSIIDGLRPVTQQIWERMSPTDKRRFKKRLAPFWDVHRSRVPLGPYKVLRELIEAGSLEVGAGAVLSATPLGDRIDLELGRPNPTTIRADWVINCTGPDCNWQAAKLPVLESLVSLGLASYDELGMGISVDRDGRTGDSGLVWALGPICRGTRWETIAIPEIRVQAQRIAECILSER